MKKGVYSAGPLLIGTFNGKISKEPSGSLQLFIKPATFRYPFFIDDPTNAIRSFCFIEPLRNRATDLPLLIIPAGQVSSHKSINKDSDEETGPDNMRMDQVNSCNWSSIPARKEIGTT
jgi:hypothetical protein